MKKALVSGVTGQDGSYLVELLLSKDYEVAGIVRRSSNITRHRIDHLRDNPNFELYYGDMCDASSLSRIIDQVEPDEIYNLAAQSHVGISFKIPEYTIDVAALGVVRLLDCIKRSGREIKLYQASTSEMFSDSWGKSDETTHFSVNSPYGCAKLLAHNMSKIYRRAFGMFICCGILFNHESPRRGENFVTKKVTSSLSRIRYGLQDKLYLGNLDARRDWGYAKDYVEAMWMMMQHTYPGDYIIATGEVHTVREFVEEAGECLGMDIKWEGRGVKEKGYVDGEVIIEIDPKFYRPLDVNFLLGDYSMAKRILGWKPKTTFKELVKIMVQEDLKYLVNNGFNRLG